MTIPAYRPNTGGDSPSHSEVHNSTRTRLGGHLPGDGVTDETDLITQQLADYGSVRLHGVHLTSAPITLGDEQAIYGRGEIVNKTTDLLILNGRQQAVRDVELTAWAGHCIIPTVAQQCILEGIQATVLTANKSVWYQIEGDVAVEVLVQASTFSQAASATAPIVSVDYTTTGVFNHNAFKRVRFSSGGFNTANTTTAPQVLLKRRTANHIYNPQFDHCVFEVAEAGAIHSYGTLGMTIQDCTVYDTGYFNDTIGSMWYIAKDPAGISARQTTFINVNRIGGTLGTPTTTGTGYDIEIMNDGGVVGHVPGSIIVDNCGGSSDVTSLIHADFLAEVRGGRGTIITT